MTQTARIESNSDIRGFLGLSHVVCLQVFTDLFLGTSMVVWVVYNIKTLTIEHEIT